MFSNSGRSWMYVIKHNGPKQDPCGMPPFIVIQFERSWPSFTLCLLPDRKPAIHLMKMSDSLLSISTSILCPIDASRFFPSAGVSDISLISVLMFFGFDIFGTGVTFAAFHRDDSTPSLNKEWEMTLIGALIVWTASLSSQLHMPSGPLALMSLPKSVLGHSNLISWITDLGTTEDPVRWE